MNTTEERLPIESDPLIRVRNGVSDWLRGLPGSVMAERSVREVQARALRELKYQLEHRDYPLEEGGIHDRFGSLLLGDAESDPSRLLGLLLEDARAQNADEARATYACYVFRQLVPDEARILSAMQTGTAYPLIHVALGPPIGPVTRHLAENFSTVGSAARVRLPHYLPHYVSKLLALNLVDEAEELEVLDPQYSELETSSPITKLKLRAEKQSKLAVRFVRRSLRISPLGQDLWQHFGPDQSAKP